MFVGVLSKDDEWLEHTLEKTLPLLEERALRLALECKKSGNARRMIRWLMKHVSGLYLKMPAQNLEKSILQGKRIQDIRIEILPLTIY